MFSRSGALPLSSPKSDGYAGLPKKRRTRRADRLELRPIAALPTLREQSRPIRRYWSSSPPARVQASSEPAVRRGLWGSIMSRTPMTSGDRRSPTLGHDHRRAPDQTFRTDTSKPGIGSAGGGNRRCSSRCSTSWVAPGRNTAARSGPARPDRRPPAGRDRRRPIPLRRRPRAYGLCRARHP